MIGRLSAEQVEHLRRLQIHGSRDASDFGLDSALIKSLEVHGLIYSLKDGRLRDLGMGVRSSDEARGRYDAALTRLETGLTLPA